MFYLDCMFIKAWRKEFLYHEIILVIFTLRRDLDYKSQILNDRNRIKCVNIYVVTDFKIPIMYLYSRLVDFT